MLLEDFIFFIKNKYILRMLKTGFRNFFYNFLYVHKYTAKCSENVKIVISI